ncbi:MAG: hypothetical protein R3F61_02005 [Myxococcota bacterium]
MRRFLSVATLTAAAAASLATSEAPPDTTLTPIAPYTHAIVLQPGDSVTADFRVGVPVSSLGQISSSWASAGGLIYATGGAADVELSLEGAFDGDSVLIGTDPTEPYEDSVLVDGLESGCIDSSGTCWTTWTLTLTHTGGPGTAELHWKFDPFATTASGPLQPSVIEF